MSNQIEQLLPILQGLPENTLTRDIIIPLLKSRDYINVEFFGGVNEEGKDIVFWEKDKLGELKLLVAQVKHFKFSNKASGNNSFQTIVNQLTACLTKSLVFPDKSVHTPSNVYLITSFPIDVKTMQTRFSAHPNFQNINNIQIIDGTRLASLLLEHKPDIVRELLGVDSEIAEVIAPTLNNQLLLKALGYHGKKELKKIYTDIDFSLGKRSTELLFNTSFKPVEKLIKLNKADWLAFKDNCILTEDEFPHTYFIRSISEIEKEYDQTQKSYNKWRLNLEEINELLTKERDILKKKRNLSHSKETIRLLEEKQRHLLKTEPQLEYSIELNGSPLVKMLENKRKWIEAKIKEFNRVSPNIERLREFMENCNSIIDKASIVLSNHIIVGCINPEGEKVLRSNFESTRLKLLIDKVFDTGLNIMVLGDAGAGKSTSLQMYALSNLKNSEKLIVWVPLSRVMHYWLRADAMNENKPFNLVEGIVNYLSSLDVKIHVSDFEKILKKRKVVVLLDAIDEVFNLSSTLIDGIKDFAAKHKNVQVISTSRMSGSYVKDLPFFSVTLLPFTDKQRDQFINNWFDSDDSHIAYQIKKHLKENKSISETIKNPLLTTTLCVLAEHNLQLPDTEMKLYDDRIKLLTGYYDSVKTLDSRLSSTPHILEELSQKLAYYLHSKEKREEDVTSLKEQALRLLNNKANSKTAKKAFDELIDPCNILIPMSDDGKIGFGHLRFQEHLAAKEIFSNRSIDIFPLLQKDWWRSVLLMCCKMNHDLEWLIREASMLSNISSIKQPLLELIKTRPDLEQVKLKQLLYNYIDNENLFMKLERSSFDTEDEFNNGY